MDKFAELDALLNSKGPKRVLILEDFVPVGQALKARCLLSGFSAEWFVGADEIREKTYMLSDDSQQRLLCELGPFDLAFLDYQVISATLTGANIAARLSGTCPLMVGISSDEKFNQRILAAGASVAYSKSIIRAWLGLT